MSSLSVFFCTYPIISRPKSYYAPYSDQNLLDLQHLHVWRLCFASLRCTSISLPFRNWHWLRGCVHSAKRMGLPKQKNREWQTQSDLCSFRQYASSFAIKLDLLLVRYLEHRTKPTMKTRSEIDALMSKVHDPAPTILSHELSKVLCLALLVALNSQIAPRHLVMCQQPGRLLSRQQPAVKAEIRAPLVIEGGNQDIPK